MKIAIALLGAALLVDPCVRDARAQPQSPRDTTEDGKVYTLSKEDRAFVHAAAMGGLFEVKLGEAIASKATRGDVRKFAQHMVDDHTRGNQTLAELCKRKGIYDLPTKLDDAHQKELDETTKLVGAALDRRYVTMMVQDHQDDVDEFTHMTTAATDPDVRDFATKALPMLKEHLKTIQAIDAKMQGKTK
jgi:putative membrane protein